MVTYNDSKDTVSVVFDFVYLSREFPCIFQAPGEVKGHTGDTDLKSAPTPRRPEQVQRCVWIYGSDPPPAEALIGRHGGLSSWEVQEPRGR